LSLKSEGVKTLKEDAVMSAGTVPFSPGLETRTASFRGGSNESLDRKGSKCRRPPPGRTPFPLALRQRLRLLLGVALLVYANPAWPQTNLIANGSFDAALDSWSVWTERGSLAPEVMSAQLHLQSVNHNGGV